MSEKKVISWEASIGVDIKYSIDIHSKLTESAIFNLREAYLLAMGKQEDKIEPSSIIISFKKLWDKEVLVIGNEDSPSNMLLMVMENGTIARVTACEDRIDSSLYAVSNTFGVIMLITKALLVFIRVNPVRYAENLTVDFSTKTQDNIEKEKE